MQRKPGETVQELAARIRQDAVKCDFSAIKDPQDEAMRTRFICSVGNEAVLKAIFKVPDNELTFAKAIDVAQETEDAARVAKETVYGSRKDPVLKVKDFKEKSRNQRAHHKTCNNDFPKEICPRCGRSDYRASVCKFKDAQCRYCKKKGHIERVCMQKKKQTSATANVDLVTAKPTRSVNTIQDREPLVQSVYVKNKDYKFQVDTGSGDNFCDKKVWIHTGKPKLLEPDFFYVGANGQPINVMGRFSCAVRVEPMGQPRNVEFVVSKDPLNLLGRTALRKLDIDVTALLRGPTATLSTSKDSNQVHAISVEDGACKSLQIACQRLCQEFPDLFKPELGCLRDFKLEVKFKPDAQPVFCKPRTVPLALLDDLNQAYDAGIKRGIWQPVQFNSYGTPVVPIRKRLLPGLKKAELRVCGDYSVTVNSQLETHRHPIPLPEDLMRKLGGGYFFSKIDLADAYNQIELAPESQRRLALSTHRGVLLQTRLPFGISSAPGYFQEIMDQLTRDLKGVAVYLDDILVSGTDATDHLQNLCALLQRLQDNGL